MIMIKKGYELCLVVLVICSVNFYVALAISSTDCNAFFHGSKWPIPTTLNASTSMLAKLCQNQVVKEYGFTHHNKAVFATLFDIKTKIPIYSASRLLLNFTYNLPRNKNDYLYWKRMSLGLCRKGRNSNLPFMSQISTVSKRIFNKCKKYQASNRDYKNNNLGITRGHLEPRSTNNNENTKQETTYTLTNAAPQFRKFNLGSWNSIECLTKSLILRLAKNRPVYVVTGTEGWAKDNNDRKIVLNGRVRVPAFFWKAVCYPGNRNRTGWGFAVKMPNINKWGMASIAVMSLGPFIESTFPENDSPFGPSCSGVSKQPILNELVKRWRSYKRRCSYWKTRAYSRHLQRPLNDVIKRLNDGLLSF